jgi:tetratricopeptide (TPR) repeat protein
MHTRLSRFWAVVCAKEFLAVLVPMVGLLTAVIAIGHPPTWLAGVLTAAAAAIVAIVGAIRDSRERHRTDALQAKAAAANRERRYRTVLDIWPVGTVRDSNPVAVGVRPSQIADKYRRADERWAPYVPREIDDAIRASLREGGLTVIIGPAAAGKSRTAFEAALQTCSDHLLIAPVPGCLAELLELGWPGEQGRPVLLWLDRLERFATTESRHLLRLLDSTRSTRIASAVGTIRLEDFERLTSPSLADPSVSALLAQRPSFPLLADLTESERKVAQELYPGQDNLARLGEHFVAASRLRERFELARIGRTEGFAVAMAAIQWRMCGMTRRIRVTELEALYAVYLPERPGHVETTKDYLQGVRWATDVSDGVPLVVERGGSGDPEFEVVDYILSVVESDASSDVSRVPDAMWAKVVSFAAPVELVTIAKAAIGNNRFDVAARALQSALAADKLDARADAAHTYAWVLREEGGPEAEICQLYELAISTGGPAEGRQSRFSLASFLWQQGRPGEAESLYRQIASEVADASPDEARLVAWSQVNLARLLDQVGRRDDAVAAYELAVRGGSSIAEGAAHRLDQLGQDRHAPLDPYWRQVGVDPSALTPKEALQGAQAIFDHTRQANRRRRALLLRGLEGDDREVAADAARRLLTQLEPNDQALAFVRDRADQLGLALAPAADAQETTVPKVAGEPLSLDLSAHVRLREPPDPTDAKGPAVLVAAVAVEVALATAGHPVTVDTRRLLGELDPASGAKDPVEDVIRLAEGKGMPLKDGRRCTVRVQRVADLDEIPRVLGRGHPVLVRVQAWTSWYGNQRVGRSGRIEPAEDPGTKVGITTFAVVGCDEGVGLLRFVTGWGPDWGDGGLGLMERPAADQFFDRTSLREVMASPPLVSVTRPQ